MVTKSAGEAELARQLDALGIGYINEFRFAAPRRWRFDFLLAGDDPKSVFAVEVEGGAWNGGHRRGREMDKDCEKANAAVLLGFKVLRFTPSMIECGEAIATIETALGRDPSRGGMGG
jgi:very-short-patch-repair endonuclease